MRYAVDDGYGDAVDTDSDTCSGDKLDYNDVNSDDDERDDDVLDYNDDPIEKNEANSDFQMKIEAFKANRCISTWVKKLGKFHFKNTKNEKDLLSLLNNLN